MPNTSNSEVFAFKGGRLEQIRHRYNRSDLTQRLVSHKHAESVVQVYLLSYIVLLLEHGWM